MQRILPFRSVLIVLIMLTLLFTACGGRVTPDPREISAAIEATLTALPQPIQQIAEETHALQEVTAPVPTNTPRPTDSTESRVVRAILFYSPTCPHCHAVIEQTLIPMMERYGEQLEIIGIDISQPSGRQLYDASSDRYGILDSMMGVPRLVVGDRFLVGSVQIPQEFPRIVEDGLASGGIDWAPIPGLAEALAISQHTELTEGIGLAQPPSADAQAVTAVATNTPAPRFGNLIPPRQSYSHPYKIKEEYDRFEQETFVTLSHDFQEVRNLPQGSLVVIYTYDGTNPTPPEVVALIFMSHSDSWEFLRCHDLTLLIDGTPKSLNTVHDGDVRGGSVLEQVMSVIALDQFLAIVNANKVEGKLCNTVFELTPAQMEALRDVASRMQP